jgi:hypothetical protein
MDQPPPESHVRRAFSEAKLMSVPGVELVGKQHQGKALTSEPPRRHATSPGGGKLAWAARRTVATEGATRSGGDDLWGRRRRKTPHGGFCIISGRPRPAGSDYGDLPPPPRQPLPRQTFMII